MDINSNFKNNNLYQLVSFDTQYLCVEQQDQE